MSGQPPQANPPPAEPLPIEINDPPVFALNQRVRALTAVRNDGTYPGIPRGGALIEAGDVGYVHSIGEFLQRYYIYAVDFVERGRIVGMRAHELEENEPG
jgi:nitrogen fixation protein NifZ